MPTLAEHPLTRAQDNAARRLGLLSEVRIALLKVTTGLKSFHEDRFFGDHHKSNCIEAEEMLEKIQQELERAFNVI